MSPVIFIALILAFVSNLQAQVTYSRDISRLYQAKCQNCHRAGDIAPFALDSYEAARTWGVTSSA